MACADWLKVQEWLLRLLPHKAPKFHLLWKTITSHPDVMEDARWGCAHLRAIVCSMSACRSSKLSTTRFACCRSCLCSHETSQMVG